MNAYYECDWCGRQGVKDEIEEHELKCEKNPKSKKTIIYRIKNGHYHCDEESIKKMSREELEHVVLRIVNHPMKRYGITEDDLADIIKGNHTTLQWSDGTDC